MSWQSHVYDWLCFGETEQIPFLLVRYENLRIDIESELKRIASFLELNVSTAHIQNAVAFCTLHKKKQEITRKNTDLNESELETRKGIIGDWKNHFSEVNEALFWEYTKDTLLKLERG